MKKTIQYFITSCLLLTAQTYMVKGATGNPSAATLPVSTSQMTEAAVLNLRLEQISALDKSGLTQVEKKDLRTEVLSINNRLEVLSGGIYLGAGAIIIILLLLIILL